MKTLKFKVSMDDIAAIVKKGSALVLCGEAGQPSVEISYDDKYGDRPDDAEEAGDALSRAMEDW